ncbi:MULTISPECIES: methyltransferase domain-containing protein [unclassified Shewanella]|uniref:methyltransferase domain-containing protein n=1 Tax=unclassified Shewanella TaxID=196818 RepID=UPI000C83EC09|nr:MULTISPECIES: methyltransferase domain-containing protein [unclassified Shewanella]MDO6677973.1 methyltransferase domain-containing protein [Shewanella sp. 4_MG-2023]MDO6775181.1 methyltransferase domain-containing protein [Shewanella sp. 3_MG-2023]PMG50667.1 methyltransferase [Shewanella sp. 10N.286.52.B9]PMH88879.1 methyltransferase [Shewanella sp. 10N.286.48.B5]PMH98276.1 methyltransferase [Shewanella sp. 10N.286.48.A6]
MIKCPLCRYRAEFFLQDKKRAFYRCDQCGLVFANPQSHLMPAAQLQRYGRANKASKQKQLIQFIKPLLSQISAQQSGSLTGLNFGRVLDKASLDKIEHAGHRLYQYDPFVKADQQLFNQQYDFICCYRVLEHFQQPGKEWQLLSKLLKPGGWLAISTSLMTDLNHFSKWHFKNNPTHVSFYQQQTFEYLAQHSEFTLLFAAKELVLMQKTSKSDIKRILI